ncbi:MAG: diaminopropionate ammonia-lyase [Hyphomicrobiaceae bacterium]
MILLNALPDYRQPLDPVDAEVLGVAGAEAAERVTRVRPGYGATPLVSLPAMARELGVAAIHVKDEGPRFGLGSFKALGGGYAVIRLLLEEAERRLGRLVDLTALHAADVRGIASTLTFACATDGNHGRSVAQGAQSLGAQSVIFIHSGVSAEREAAIARFGARMVRVGGTYDDSVAEAARVAAREDWILVSDTACAGYERIPGLVMQGYTVLLREALRQLPELPTHVFIQAGVGGIAAALAGHLALVHGDKRPTFVVVEPARAACIFGSAKAGRLTKVDVGEPTVMAMLDCYEPSLTAWRVLTRAADAFMTLEEDEAIAIMNRLARPHGGDPAIVAGESGGVGLGGLIKAAGDAHMRRALGLEASSRALVVNTEGATDPGRYRELVGLSPADVAASEQA